MPGIRVVSDSACDLPEELISRLGLTIVPLTIRFGSDEYTDLGPKDFWATCRQSTALPETAAPSPGSFAEAYRSLASEGAEGVLCLTLSSKLSATIQSAQAAARDVEGTIPVQVVDTVNISLGQGLLVLAAARAAEEGKSLNEVAEAVKELVPRVKVLGALDTLENLKKGGRIGGAQALLGSMLSIKPVIQIVDGVVEQESRQRARSRSLRYLADKVKEAASSSEIHELGVMHGDAADVDAFIDMLTSIVPRERMIVSWVGPVIGAHAGPGVVGVAWIGP
jgi:DegV family protein with EDD domain